MALAIGSICESIAKIDVPGVQIWDINELPEGVLARDCPVLVPRIQPPGFITEFTMVRKTFMTGAGSKHEVHYKLNYTLCYAPISSDRGLLIFDDMLAAAQKVIDRIAWATTEVDGTTSVKPENPGNFGQVFDMAGNSFLGCEIAVDVLEIQEPS